MKVEFDASFYKSLKKIKDKSLLAKIKTVILLIEDAKDIQHIPNTRKLEGFKTFYRVRIGDYRLGFELKRDTIYFITIASRKDIYKTFP